MGWEGKSFLPEVKKDEITIKLLGTKKVTFQLFVPLLVYRLDRQVYKKGKFPGRFPD